MDKINHIYLVNNSGIHTDLSDVVAVYLELSKEDFIRFVNLHYTQIESLIGHDSVVDFLNILMPNHIFKVNRASTQYYPGDLLIGVKPTSRLPEVHDFQASFLSKFYKYYSIQFYHYSQLYFRAQDAPINTRLLRYSILGDDFIG